MRNYENNLQYLVKHFYSFVTFCNFFYIFVSQFCHILQIFFFYIFVSQLHKFYNFFFTFLYSVQLHKFYDTINIFVKQELESNIHRINDEWTFQLQNLIFFFKECTE